MLKINALWIMRIWARKCKLHSLYARRESKTWKHWWVTGWLWHGCENNNNNILDPIKQGILITDRKILLPFWNILSWSYAKYCKQYDSADKYKIYLNLIQKKTIRMTVKMEKFLPIHVRRDSKTHVEWRLPSL